MKEITPQFLEQIQENKRIRQRIAYEDPFWFSLLYLRHHFTHPFALFHMEMFHLIQQTEHNFIAIMAFRESGKSTIMNTANILWSILGKPGKKFVIIVSKTQEQAKSHFLNIKTELETNALLKNDFGPFVEDEEDLKRLSLELVHHGSKIMSVTREQSIRGLKYEQFRPDLLVGDDLEDISSAFNPEESEVLYSRFENEIIPIGSSGTRIVILGNLLSQDSFMMRLKRDINEGRIAGIFRTYPLLDNNGKCLWQNKFPHPDDVKKLRNKLSQEAWRQEYLLTFYSSIYFDDQPGELPDPTDATYDESLRMRCRFKFAQLNNQYKDILENSTTQKNLIQQMKEFNISAPITRSFEVPELDDPRYEKYQKYVEGKEIIRKEFREGIQDGIRARAMRKHQINQAKDHLPHSTDESSG